MAWNSLSTTLAMTGFISVIGFSIYVTSPSDQLERSERMCQTTTRDVRDFSIQFFGLVDKKQAGKIDLFLDLTDYLHTDICANYGARFFWPDVADEYIAYDAFRESLYDYSLTPSEINFVMNKGKSVGVDWQDSADTEGFLKEYLEYRKLNSQGDSE